MVTPIIEPNAYPAAHHIFFGILELMLSGVKSSISGVGILFIVVRELILSGVNSSLSCTGFFVVVCSGGSAARSLVLKVVGSTLLKY